VCKVSSVWLNMCFYLNAFRWFGPCLVYVSRLVLLLVARVRENRFFFFFYLGTETFQSTKRRFTYKLGIWTMIRKFIIPGQKIFIVRLEL
jgi:hypothetical protein